MKQIFGLLTFLVVFSSNLGAQGGLYDLDSLRSVFIEFYNPDWHDIMVENWELENGERELASLVMDGLAHDSVAIRYKGNATFYWSTVTSNPKVPLNIDMNDNLVDQDLLGYNKVKLANSFFDPTALRDVLGFDIYRHYMPAPDANWLKVFIEGEYIGLYPNTEAINRQFLNRHFDYNDGPLFKCDPSSQFGSTTAWQSSDLAWYGPDESEYYTRYNLKSDAGWPQLVNLIDILNNTPEDLETVLNIDRAIWNLAVATVLANYDTYNGYYMHNYYMYQHENGLFQMLPWDVSEVFGGALLGLEVVPDDEFYEWDIFNIDDPVDENRPLVDYVVNHPIYRKQYLAHIRTVMHEALDMEALTQTCADMQAIIATAAAEDDNAFFGIGDEYFTANLTSNASTFGLNIAGLLSTAEGRLAYLEQHQEVAFLAPTIAEVERNIELPQADDEVWITAQVTDETTVDLMVSTNGHASHFETIPMFDDGTHNDGSAGDGIYGAHIPYTDLDTEVNYYLRAQNADAMMLDPQRAEYEFHSYTVGQTTSIAELPSVQYTISAWPNPFTDKLTLEISGVTGHQPLPLKVYSTTGKLLMNSTINLSMNTATADLSSLSEGVYFVEVVGVGSVRVVRLP